MPKERDEYTADEAKSRLRKIMTGAFGEPPTPPKNIPTREGESRKIWLQMGET